jgi:hypothetical protein
MLSAAQLRAELRRLQEIAAARLGKSDLKARIEETLAEMERRTSGGICETTEERQRVAPQGANF